MNYDPLAIPQFQMLTQEQCEVIHRASLEILRRTRGEVTYILKS